MTDEQQKIDDEMFNEAMGELVSGLTEAANKLSAKAFTGAEARGITTSALVWAAIEINRAENENPLRVLQDIMNSALSGISESVTFGSTEGDKDEELDPFVGLNHEVKH
jgi:hypothetical protein